MIAAVEFQFYVGNLFDLSPLQGMQLNFLWISESKVLNLSPLKGMPLKNLARYSAEVSDLSPLEECKNLTSLDVSSTKVTPATITAIQKALPNCKSED